VQYELHWAMLLVGQTADPATVMPTISFVANGLVIVFLSAEWIAPRQIANQSP
jgi:hypothetical protein